MTEYQIDKSVISYFVGDSSLYSIASNQGVLSFTKKEITKNKIDIGLSTRIILLIFEVIFLYGNFI